ncbi:M23 family metallopeptidase [Clostridium algoriphilum]|uniref:peptidoglycan DD-metalloendopeptidase family protein n=1 Tax=Clostridium algoriphilum TaxID=198347 RepID=UPI001CF0F067|nr:M23 family metallopeptidase [Clostridium algoriphilum]MCB2294619.1 M23 family metallopeptidase [Clostridium algoriphilum]
MNILKEDKKIIWVLITTLVLTATILYLNVYKMYGYKVSVGSSTITFVKSKREFNKTYNELQRDIKFKYGNSITIKDFTLNKVKVDDDVMFINGDNLKKVMLKNFNISVDVFVMKSDDKKIAYVASENQGKEILSSLKNYYKKAGLKSAKSINIQNSITYEPVKVRIGEIHENSEITKAVIKYNDSSQIPLIAVKIVRNITKNQTIYPTTIIKSSNQVMYGVSKVEHKGINGIRKVTSVVIALNNIVVSEKVLKSETIKQVQNKEIYVGTNGPIILQAASINSPSRGSISSGFGTRWGKMHKGIDIAANFGSAINAALDGTVTYADWEDGYGNVIKISHGEGLQTTYAHCSVIIVKKGELVKRGMKIGQVGSTGHSTGPHLHFEVRENGEPINPQKYIK